MRERERGQIETEKAFYAFLILYPWSSIVEGHEGLQVVSCCVHDKPQQICSKCITTFHRRLTVVPANRVVHLLLIKSFTLF